MTDGCGRDSCIICHPKKFKEDPPKPLGTCNHQCVPLDPYVDLRFTHQCTRCCTPLNITERPR